jgi:hypothetical protein
MFVSGILALILIVENATSKGNVDIVCVKTGFETLDGLCLNYCISMLTFVERKNIIVVVGSTALRQKLLPAKVEEECRTVTYYRNCMACYVAKAAR